MSNGELQPHSSENLQIRKSRIQIGIQRTLSTAQYETIVVHYDIDEEISWTERAERTHKVNNWKTVLLEEFKLIHDDIMKDLGLSHKAAYFKGPASKQVTSVIDNLDDLDIVSK